MGQEDRELTSEECGQLSDRARKQLIHILARDGLDSYTDLCKTHEELLRNAFWMDGPFGPDDLIGDLDLLKEIEAERKRIVRRRTEQAKREVEAKQLYHELRGPCSPE